MEKKSEFVEDAKKALEKAKEKEANEQAIQRVKMHIWVLMVVMGFLVFTSAVAYVVYTLMYK